MRIYADNAATTRMSDTAISVMLDCMKNIYGNPSNQFYSVGQAAKDKLEECRAQIAAVINAERDHLHLRRQRGG